MGNKFKKKMDYSEQLDEHAVKLKSFLEKNRSKFDRYEISKKDRLIKFPSNAKKLNDFCKKHGLWLHPHEKVDFFYVSLDKKLKN